MADLPAGAIVGTVSTWLLTYLLHSTVVVGAVWCLLKMGWVRRPTTLDLLWKVSLVAGLATASVAVFRPAIVESRRLDMEVVGAGPGEGLSWLGTDAPGVIRLRAAAVDPTPMCRAALERMLREPNLDPEAVSGACGAGGTFPWRPVLTWVWLLGAGGLLVRGLALRLGVRRSLHGVRPAPGELRAVAGALLARRGGDVGVVVSASVEAPCVVGGRIVLPDRCVRDLSPEQIRAVLAHEVAHVVRRDPAWMTLADLLCRALWVQPLNRLALKGLRECAELVCDDWAVERTRTPLDLATSIARVAEWISPARRAPEAVLAHLAHLARGEGRALSARVRRILTPGLARRDTPRLVRLLVAVLVVAPTLALPAVPRATALAVFVRREAVTGAPGYLIERPGDHVTVEVRRITQGDL